MPLLRSQYAARRPRPDGGKRHRARRSAVSAWLAKTSLPIRFRQAWRLFRTFRSRSGRAIPDDLLKRDREAARADSGCVPDGIRDRARRADDSDFPTPLMPSAFTCGSISSTRMASTDGTSAFTGTWYSARFALITRPERESTPACSCKAKDSPQIMPPYYWLHTSRGLMIVP